MPFVKLDVGILDSTLWIEKDQRDVFLTALLMAQPREFSEPTPQIEVDSMDLTGFIAPPGWYGFCPAAGAGIVRRSLTEHFAGMKALRALGNPDPESRSKEFEGRRLIRVNGGYMILNFMAYRDRDYGAAERMRRMRERKKRANVQRNGDAVPRNDTQADSRGQKQSADPLPTRGNGSARAARGTPLPNGHSFDPDAGGELALARGVLEHIGVPADAHLIQIAGESIRLLAKEGGTLQTAANFIIEAGIAARGGGETVNRFWFSDQRYRPEQPRKSRKTRDLEAAAANFTIGAMEES